MQITSSYFSELHKNISYSKLLLVWTWEHNSKYTFKNLKGFYDIILTSSVPFLDLSVYLYERTSLQL
jgi:hypothetical protein